MTPPHHRPSSLLLLLCLLLSIGALTACSGELDPQDPEEAYELFRTALFEGDPQGVWQRSDDQTRDYFEDRYRALVEMDELIERYLPATDHQLARAQSGAELTDHIDDGHQLFVHLFDGASMAQEEAIRFGSNAAQVQMAEDGETARLITRSDQQFDLIRHDEEWYINFIDSDAFDDRAMAWLDSNEEALTQTVEDLIDDERREREAIITDLLQNQE